MSMTPAQMEIFADTIARMVLERLKNPDAAVAVANERYLTTTEAAEVLGVSQATIERLTAVGSIPSHKIGRCRRYLASELREVRIAKAKQSTSKTKKSESSHTAVTVPTHSLTQGTGSDQSAKPNKSTWIGLSRKK